MMAKVKAKAKAKATAKVEEKVEGKEKVGDGLWGEAVGATGTVVLMVYQTLLTILLIVVTVKLLGKICRVSGVAASCDVRVILLVILLGALGAQIRCVRSLAWYVGNRDLKKSWVPTYLLSPLVGSMLALVFFLLVRGGLVALSADMTTPSEVGLAGASALVGMFSDEASVKFKAIAGAIFSTVEKGKDSDPGKDGEGA